MDFQDITAVANDEAKATELFERLRWPNGPVCPHCGASDRTYALQGVKDKKGRVRHGLKKCGHCRKQFTARVGTIFEDSHVPISKWLHCIYEMSGAKKGVSAAQLQRKLGVNYRTAWFMCHRIREAMTKEPLASKLGGEGGIVEIDETFVGGKVSNNKHRNRTDAAGKKIIVMTLVDREGDARRRWYQT
jgi:transposase-like protein